MSQSKVAQKKRKAAELEADKTVKEQPSSKARKNDVKERKCEKCVRIKPIKFWHNH